MNHSERAKRNTRLGVDLRIRTIEARIAGIKKEIALYRKYQRYGLSPNFIKRVLTALEHKLAERQRVLKVYKERRARYKREGKI